MTGSKGGVATKLKENLCKTMIKVPTVYSKTPVSSSTSTQTQAIIDIDTDSIASVEISKLECTLDITSSSDFLNTNLESDDSSSQDDLMMSNISMSLKPV